ncbi:MAG: VPLPA-CTERM sorting domain-containing protein [Gammaproteobacteria bacterium]
MKNRKEKNLKSVLAVAVLSGLSMSASEAAAVYLTPASQTAALSSGSVTLELYMDFSGAGEQTVGGGIDLDFQGAISMGTFTPTSYFTNTADPFFTGHGTVDADNDYEIHFGNFAGLSGVNKLGDISVNLLGVGAASVNMAINTYYGDFYSTSSQLQNVTLSGAQINVVPVPAAVWLFGSALGLMGAVRRRSVV